MMKILKCFILLLFVFSVFNCASVSTNVSQQFIDEDKDGRNYDSWYRDHQWLILGQEKERWKSLKSDQEREYFIEEFYEARDPDTFTAKNEFKLGYQDNLKKVHKDYPDPKDARRYIYLRFGEPQLRRVFVDRVVFIDFLDGRIRIRVDKGEIWKYGFGKQNFQVIFAELDPQYLQWFKDQPKRDVSSFSFSSSRQEILYIGSRSFTGIDNFLKSFFQENFRLQATLDTINDLKKPILERAEEFYKESQPRVKTKQYSHDWEKGLEPLIDQFDMNLSEEVGIFIWLTFDKDSLDCSKKNRYRADISLYCEVRDSNNKRIIYYRDDDANYELKKKQRYYYHFWGSLPAGNYTLILEVGNNIAGKKYREEFQISDYSALPALKANIWVGRAVKEAERVKGKPGYLFLPSKEGIFCPAVSLERFYDHDELVIIFNISGFRKNHYGISYVETSLSFIKGEIENLKFVPIKEVFRYRFPSVEKSKSRFQSWLKIKVEDFVEKSKLPPGLHLLRVRLLVWDVIANQGYGSEYPLEYPRTIPILGTFNRNNLNNFNSIGERN